MRKDRADTPFLVSNTRNETGEWGVRRGSTRRLTVARTVLSDADLLPISFLNKYPVRDPCRCLEAKL